MKKRIPFILKAILVAGIFIASLKPLHAAEAKTESHKERVGRIAARLEPFSGLKPRVHVPHDASLGAYVLPNRTVVITSGLVEACATDDELAFILAHETAHIIAHDFDHIPAPEIGASDLPQSLLREVNADINGVFFARKAGYSPRASVEILGRISSSATPVFKSRLETLRRFLDTTAE